MTPRAVVAKFYGDDLAGARLCVMKIRQAMARRLQIRASNFKYCAWIS